MLILIQKFLSFMADPDSIKGYDPPLKELPPGPTRCDKCGRAF